MAGGSDLRFVSSADGLERSRAGFCRCYYSHVFLSIPFHASQENQLPGRRLIYHPGGVRFLASLACAPPHLLAPSRSCFHRHPGDVSTRESESPEDASAPDDPMG